MSTTCAAKYVRLNNKSPDSRIRASQRSSRLSRDKDTFRDSRDDRWLARIRESGDLLFSRTYLAAHVVDKDVSFLHELCARFGTYVYTTRTALGCSGWHVHYAPADSVEPSRRLVRLHVCTWLYALVAAYPH